MGFLQAAKSDNADQPVAVQYLPPENGSDMYLNSSLLGGVNLITATLIDLAVRHNISIHEQEAKAGLFGIKGKPSYELKFISDTGMTDGEKEFLRAFMDFPQQTSYTIDPSKTDRQLAKKMTSLNTGSHQRAVDFGYLKDISKPRRNALIALSIGFLLVFAPLILPNFLMIADDLIIGRMVVLGLLLVIAITVVAVIRPLSAKGSAAKNHLKGLKDYIKLSETDRINFLQSQTGAPKGADGKIALYERVLPYAVFFGLEKSWAKVLEQIYLENPDYVPAWYYGVHGFSAANFAESVAAFAPSVDAASSYSDSGSGSGGGGSSGGGGGGGGGGGW